MPLQTPNKTIRLNAGQSVRLGPDDQDVLIEKVVTLADVSPSLVYLPRSYKKGIDVKIRAAGVSGSLNDSNYVSVMATLSDRIEVVGSTYRLTTQYEEVVLSPKIQASQSGGLDPSGWFVRSGAFNCGLQASANLGVITNGIWNRFDLADFTVQREIIGDGTVFVDTATGAAYIPPSDGVYELFATLNTLTESNVPTEKPGVGKIIGVGWSRVPTANAAPFAANYVYGDGTVGVDVSCCAIVRGVGQHGGGSLYADNFFPVVYSGEDAPVDWESEVSLVIGVRKIN